MLSAVESAYIRAVVKDDLVSRFTVVESAHLFSGLLSVELNGFAT